MQGNVILLTAFQVLTDLHEGKILLDPCVVEAVNRARDCTTSELESFHSCLNRNAPKTEGFFIQAC